MKQGNFSTKEKAVISALSNEHLTLLEILSKISKGCEYLPFFTYC